MRSLSPSQMLLRPKSARKTKAHLQTEIVKICKRRSKSKKRKKKRQSIHLHRTDFRFNRERVEDTADVLDMTHLGVSSMNEILKMIDRCGP